MEKQIIKPIIPNFVNMKSDYVGSPILSLEQNNIHYSGHYIKYINKFNELIKSDKQLNKIYNLIISKFNIDDKNNNNNEQRNILILAGIKFFNEKTQVYRNSSQIYNHELYWKTITDINNSTVQLKKLKYKLFNSDTEFDNFYKKFVDEGNKEFGSGWIWICKQINESKLDVFTTHDSKVPFDDTNIKILGVVDLWEHAFYIDYPADKKKYLELSFKTLNWKNFLV